jgi:Chalcone isomerase-like
MNLYLSILVSILALHSGCCNVVVSAGSSGMVDPATGISFPSQKNGLEIFGVGIRKKGPIKIYSVACYGNKTVKDSLSTVSRSKTNDKDVYAAFQNSIVQQPTGSTTSFVLQMAMKVGAAKMAAAIADSVSPRHKSGNPKDVEQLKDLIFQGVSKNGEGAATKGTTFQFDCHSNTGMDVTVNNKHIGTVSSPTLSNAFCNVYCDNDCVSPALRKSCIEHCCAE